MRLFLTVLIMISTFIGGAFAQQVITGTESPALLSQYLNRAVRNGNLEAVTDLIAKGADIDVLDAKTGRNPLHEAAANAHLGLIEILLANDSTIIDDLDESGYSALHLAVDNRHLGALNLLVVRGADINTTLPNQQTPLHTALTKNYIPITRYLIKQGAFIAADDKGLTPLHYAVAGGYIDIAGELIEQGAAVEDIDNIGNTPLHYSATSGQLDMTAFLLNQGALSDVLNNAGQTPFVLAGSSGFPRVSSLLRVYQNDPSIRRVVFRSNIPPDSSGWRDLLPARSSDGANQDALPQIEAMVTGISERYLSLIDVSIPELLPRPQLPNPLDVRQGLFESDFEFGFRAVREVGEYRTTFYRIQRGFEQDVESRNARIASLRERVELRRNQLEVMLPLFKRDAIYEVLRDFRLEDPVFNPRNGGLSFALTSTGALYQQRVAIRPLDQKIVEELYNAPQRASVSVSIMIEEEHVVLEDVFIEYDDENIYKAQIIRVDALGNPISRGRELSVNGDEIGNDVEQNLSDDAVFRQQNTDLVLDSTVANVRYSNNRGVPIIYSDNAASILEDFVENNFGASLQLNDSDIFDPNDEILQNEVLASAASR